MLCLVHWTIKPSNVKRTSCVHVYNSHYPQFHLDALLSLESMFPPVYFGLVQMSGSLTDPCVNRNCTQWTLPHCTVDKPHGTLYRVHSTLYTVHCTLYRVHCTLCTVHFQLYTVNTVDRDGSA